MEHNMSSHTESYVRRPSGATHLSIDALSQWSLRASGDRPTKARPPPACDAVRRVQRTVLGGRVPRLSIL